MNRTAAPKKYDSIDFKPPAGVAEAAARGLDYRARATPSERGGLTPAEASAQGVGSGVQRAVNLKNRDTISPEVIGQMVSFFARHEKNKGVDPEYRGEPWRDKGHVAWLLWGGDPGRSWAEKVHGAGRRRSQREGGRAARPRDPSRPRQPPAPPRAPPAPQGVGA